MVDSILKRLKRRELPSSLKSRRGWAEFFESIRSAEPHLHQLEPTNHCPYTCIMCPRPTRLSRPKGYMDSVLFEKIINEVSTHDKTKDKEIELFHFGESLLHPDIVDMVSYVSQKGLKGVLSVNGPQLHPEIGERILHARPFKLIVSLDGYDDASYKKIRGHGADYDKAIRNIEALLSAHSAEPAPTRVVIRMIRLHINQDHEKEFTRMWEGKGAEVEVRDFFPWSHKELMALGQVEKYPPSMPCPFPWQYLVVQWNGDVVPCCRDLNGINRVGNVRDHSLKDIWNGSSYARFREMMASGDYNNALCEECMSIYYSDRS